MYFLVPLLDSREKKHKSSIWINLMQTKLKLVFYIVRKLLRYTQKILLFIDEQYRYDGNYMEQLGWDSKTHHVMRMCIPTRNKDFNLKDP